MPPTFHHRHHSRGTIPSRGSLQLPVSISLAKWATTQYMLRIPRMEPCTKITSTLNAPYSFALFRAADPFV